ncbi:HxlR family transcriptional regulator [Virgibacillus soli]|uniref:HxlR family transcriptional regulator n=1 Tax=Lederbergia galactosidilytica TaxID=217031 RepID=A0A177ZM91_9BACI|nr:helix-turn-helix domain-containing protein [Lederbergia galactosidilytica]KRG14834.1 HxlR family transcriptional regulator [Virgibacillus soli]MBP1914506.1 DNA-binding HxlR family transcriptional regulator [Lederbergia galactosidilytica]OAK69082.1 HxlR family transcriptional regulator [Lederbergia galactosidilytica]
MRIKYNLPCNIAQTLNIIGDRWTLLIIHEILTGNTTFNEMKKSLDGISANLLSERLKYLEKEGLVQSTLYSDHPPRYKYTLTESGEDLEHVFHSLILWGSQHLEKCYKRLVHAPTGDEVGITYYSKKTGEIVYDLDTISIEEGQDN